MAETNIDINGKESNGAVINVEEDNIDHVSKECVNDASKPGILMESYFVYFIYVCKKVYCIEYT